MRKIINDKKDVRMQNEESERFIITPIRKGIAISLSQLVIGLLNILSFN